MTDIFRLVRQHAETRPSAVAIVAPGRAPLTYAGLRRQVEDVVASLHALGVGRNDRVVIVLPDGPELAVAILAIGAGATCAPLNPTCRDREFDSALVDLGATALVVLAGSDSPAVAVAARRGIPLLELSVASGAAAGVFELAGPTRRPAARCEAAGPDDTLLLLHTSGTASRPKRVPLTHRNIFASARAICATLELTSGDRCLSVMPLFHIHGLSAIFASLTAGASVVCPPGFAAPQFHAWLQEFRPTWYTAAPAVHRMILTEARQRPGLATHSTLRFIRSASSAMPPQLIADMERTFGVPFIEAYGMTEAAPQVASNRLPPHTRKRGSVGKAAGPDVAIMDESGNLLPPGASGEVVIRGANVMSRYETDDGGDAVHSRTAGSGPAIWVAWIGTAICSSPAGCRRSSIAAGKRFRRRRWTTSSGNTRPWPRPSASRCPIPRSASASPRRSSCATACGRRSWISSNSRQADSLRSNCRSRSC